MLGLFRPNAVLKLCTILLYTSGYRTSGAEAHFYTIEALPLILGDGARKDADYLWIPVGRIEITRSMIS